MKVKILLLFLLAFNVWQEMRIREMRRDLTLLIAKLRVEGVVIWDDRKLLDSLKSEKLTPKEPPAE